jgi:hypothetical protein
MNTIEPDPTYVLPPDLYRRALIMLRQVLPPPLTGDPADTTQRDLDAMAEVASMRPVNAVETALAAQFVAANALAFDIMAVITESPVDAMKHWAASGAMLRHSHGALSSLAREKGERMKLARARRALAPGRPDATVQVQPPQADAASGALPPVQSAAISEIQSHDAADETDVRPGNLVLPASLPASRPRPVPFVPDPEIIEQIAADYRAQRQARPALRAYGSRHAKSPARYVPSDETVSRVPGYETGVRLDRLALPSAAPEQSVPDLETILQSSGNETMMRPGV